MDVSTAVYSYPPPLSGGLHGLKVLLAEKLLLGLLSLSGSYDPPAL